MIFDLTRLKNGIIEYIDIDSGLEIPKQLLINTSIIEVKNIKVTGSIEYDNINYLLNLNVSGTMILPCSLTLEPTDYDFNCEISGNIEELLAEIDENNKKVENTIDILPIIWENILMEVPIKVISPKTSTMQTEGNGWKFIKEMGPRENPELAKLKDLL